MSGAPYGLASDSGAPPLSRPMRWTLPGASATAARGQATALARSAMSSRRLMTDLDTDLDPEPTTYHNDKRECIGLPPGLGLPRRFSDVAAGRAPAIGYRQIEIFDKVAPGSYYS